MQLQKHFTTIHKNVGRMSYGLSVKSIHRYIFELFTIFKKFIAKPKCPPFNKTRYSLISISIKCMGYIDTMRSPKINYLISSSFCCQVIYLLLLRTCTPINKYITDMRKCLFLYFFRKLFLEVLCVFFLTLSLEEILQFISPLFINF